MEPIPFVKGHGTENDFVVLTDPDGRLDLDGDAGALVRALCHRRRGLGADGVLRVLRTDAATGWVPDVPADAVWFMDYRNADGSIAEMCGNGIRVFGRYLVEAGLVLPGTHRIATRAGVRTVTVGAPEDDVVVDMGPARVGPASTARVGRHELVGLAVDVGNPHLACVTTETVAPLDALDLSAAPGYDTALFPAGVNVEVLTPIRDAAEGRGQVRLRVHERGSGETRSCGTGTVAGAVAALHHAGLDTGEVTVHTPGGALAVTVGEATSTLSGPAVLVARGTFGAGPQDAARWVESRRVPSAVG